MRIIKKEDLEQMEKERQVAKPVQTLNDIKSKLFELGEQWRKDNEYTVNAGKENKQVKVPMPKPSEISKVLNEVCDFVFIGTGTDTDMSQLYLYNPTTGLYTASRDTFNALCLAFDVRTISRTWLEVYNVLRTKVKMYPPLNDKNLIPVANGVFNFKTQKLEPFDPKFIITSKIKTRYNPLAAKPILGGWFDFDVWLSSIACGDSEIITLLWQVMNEAINPNHTRGKMVIMLGSGANGKGTYQKLLQNLIGAENISNMRPPQFGEKHLLSALEGKVCNIGDDISNKYLDEVSDLMSIVTGDTVQVNPKGKKPYEATYKTLCLFSANELPRSRNKSQGWYRRLCIVPFNADFNGQKERPEIKNEFLSDPSLLEYVLFKVLHMPKFDSFIDSKAVKQVIAEYKEDNDYILSFVLNDYMARNLHMQRKVPLKWVKIQLEDYLEDNAIKGANIYGYGSKIVSCLNKETSATYVKKFNRLSQKDIDEINDKNLWGVEFLGHGDMIIKL